MNTAQLMMMSKRLTNKSKWWTPVNSNNRTKKMMKTTMRVKRWTKS